MSIVISFMYLSASLYVVAGVRVCPNFAAYDWIFSKQCYDNPASNQNITEVVRSWGFTAEENYVITDDGYILLLVRAYSGITKETPIIVVHGIGMNGMSFTYRGNNSLVYFLGKQGYDVWILNYRGMSHSRGHINLTTKDKKYWSFSLNDLGIYDVRSTIKYVYGKTNRQAIYIGYSMGTTGFYVYSTTFPEECKLYVKGMIGIGPVVTFKKVKSPLQISAQPFVWPIIRLLVYLFWNGEILPGYTKLVKPLVKSSLGLYIIQTVFNIISGPDYEQMDAISYPLMPEWLDVAGVEIYTHYVQIYQSGVFQNYDHGKSKNLQIYHQAKPPAYNLSKVPVCVALFVGANDWLASPENAQQLYSELPDSSRCGYHLIANPKWNHYDFLMAKDIENYLFRNTFHKIVLMENGNYTT